MTARTGGKKGYEGQKKGAVGTYCSGLLTWLVSFWASNKTKRGRGPAGEESLEKSVNVHIRKKMVKRGMRKIVRSLEEEKFKKNESAGRYVA